MIAKTERQLRAEQAAAEAKAKQEAILKERLERLARRQSRLSGAGEDEGEDGDDDGDDGGEEDDGKGGSKKRCRPFEPAEDRGPCQRSANCTRGFKHPGRCNDSTKTPKAATPAPKPRGARATTDEKPSTSGGAAATGTADAAAMEVDGGGGGGAEYARRSKGAGLPEEEAEAEAAEADAEAEAEEEWEENEEAEAIICSKCFSGADEERLILCDGCDDAARHLYCARPELTEVPSGDWYCEACSLRRQLVGRGLSEEQARSKAVRAELRRPSHGVAELWRAKVPLARTAGEVLRHVRQLVEALNRAAVRPYVDENAEAAKCLELEWKTRESAAQSREKEERAQQREVAATLDALLKQLEKEERSQAKELERAAARAAREREAEEKRGAAAAARLEKEAARREAEVRRCVDKLVLKVEKGHRQSLGKGGRPSLGGGGGGGGGGGAKHDEERYCVCNRPYNAKLFYIACDLCENWYHGKCVGITEEQGDYVTEYVCAECHVATGAQTAWLAFTPAALMHGTGAGAGASTAAPPGEEGAVTSAAAEREEEDEEDEEDEDGTVYPRVVFRKLKEPAVVLRLVDKRDGTPVLVRTRVYAGTWGGGEAAAAAAAVSASASAAPEEAAAEEEAPAEEEEEEAAAAEEEAAAPSAPVAPAAAAPEPAAPPTADVEMAEAADEAEAVNGGNGAGSAEGEGAGAGDGGGGGGGEDDRTARETLPWPSTLSGVVGPTTSPPPSAPPSPPPADDGDDDDDDDVWTPVAFAPGPPPSSPPPPSAPPSPPPGTDDGKANGSAAGGSGGDDDADDDDDDEQNGDDGDDGDDMMHDAAGAAGVWPISAGMRAELSFPDEGMAGSWYPVEVLATRDGTSATASSSGGAGAAASSSASSAKREPEQQVLVLVPALIDATQPDGKLREWHPRSRLRPPPPPQPADFLEGLHLGALVETWYQEGWWQVSIKEMNDEAAAVPSPGGAAAAGGGSGGAAATAATGADASRPRMVLESVQFGNSHRPQGVPVLRPCWRWQPRRQPAWTQMTSERQVLQRDAAANGKGGGGGGAGGKRKASDLTPGAKEIEQEKAARETARILEQFAVGSVVEVRGTEEGFLGSWYAAHVLEAREARSTVKLRLCYQAFQEDDGSKWEDWIEARHVRPLPPQHKPDFIRHLKRGAPLELLLEEGWWEVEFEGADKGSGANYLVAAKRYKVQHTVPVARLRPAWKWSADCTGWEVHTEKPPALSNSEVVAPRPTATATKTPAKGGKSGGGGSASKPQKKK